MGRGYNRAMPTVMPIYAYVIIVVGALFWFLPFPLTGWSRVSPASSDPRARWGIMLQAVSYAVVWQGHFWLRSPSGWHVFAAVVFLLLAALLSWTSTRALGRHLRFDAALSPDHQLVKSGPYGLLRHPIYTSMLCLLLGTASIVASPIPFVGALVVFLAGTEIRVQIEDKLLAARFGSEFRDYQGQVSAYIPYIR
jgi:protein-S-isoprenylcysteine O-methyltransferase Ste14